MFQVLVVGVLACCTGVAAQSNYDKQAISISYNKSAGGEDSNGFPIRSGHKLNSILLTFHNHGSMQKSAFSTDAQTKFA